MLKVYISFRAESVDRDIGYRLQADAPDELRRFQQTIDLADDVWRKWVVANDGSVLCMGRGQGILEIPPSRLGELPELQRRYAEALESGVGVGVGTRLDEADRALKLASHQGGDRVVLYGPDVDKKLEDAKGDKDPLKSLVKALSHTGAATPQAFAEASEHSEGEAAAHQIQDAAEDAPPAPEATHAASDLEEQFHQLAQDQAQDDEKSQGRAQDDKAAIKSSIASVLKQVRGQSEVLSQLKQGAPDAYNAVMALVQGVIAMAHSLDGSPVAKSEPLVKMTKKTSDATAERMTPHTLSEYEGLQRIHSYRLPNTVTLRGGPHRLHHHVIETPALEGHQPVLHTISVSHDPSDSRAVLSSASAGEVPVSSVSGHPFLHGKALQVGEMATRGGARNRGVATLLYQRMLAHHGRILSDDHTSDGADAVWDHLLASPGVKGARGTGPKDLHWAEADKGSLTPRTYEFNGKSLHQAPQTWEDPTTFGKEELKPDLEKAKLPMPESKPHHDVILPVGSVKDDTKKVKVKHGSQKTSWVQMRAGAVSAIADRHADPVLGSAAHPLSSRNPTGN